MRQRGDPPAGLLQVIGDHLARLPRVAGEALDEDRCFHVANSSMTVDSRRRFEQRSALGTALADLADDA